MLPWKALPTVWRIQRSGFAMQYAFMFQNPQFPNFAYHLFHFVTGKHIQACHPPRKARMQGKPQPFPRHHQARNRTAPHN